ncbi:MAG: hypothetical protein IJZ88_04945 [Clostridia bacterium]|nr:hypothetical protein [Clostridia bacterium]
MKNKKLTFMLLAGFVALALIVGGVAGVYSQLEPYPIGDDDTTVEHKGNDTLTFRNYEFKTGNFVISDNDSIKDCVLLLNDQLGIKEIYPSKYAPVFGEVKTRYYYRNSGNIICEKTATEKSQYQRTAYSKQTFEIPEIKLENIKKINVCYGSYYDSVSGYTVEGVSDFFAATVDGDCPKFNLMKYKELSEAKEIRDFVNEFNRTGSLKESYKLWSENSGKDNVFFQVFFIDSSIPCSLLFTKEAINAQ